MRIETALEVADIVVLFGVHLVVREDELHVVEHEFHGG